jgi:hypothetical protein
MLVYHQYGLHNFSTPHIFLLRSANLLKSSSFIIYVAVTPVTAVAPVTFYRWQTPIAAIK